MTDIRTKVEALISRVGISECIYHGKDRKGYVDDVYVCKLESLVRASVGLCEAVEMAIDLIEHEHSDDERGWTSMCIDCENERIYREKLAAFEAEVERARK